MRHKLIAAFLLSDVVLFLTACNFPQPVLPEIVPSAIPPTAFPATVPADVRVDLDRPKYILDTVIDYERHFITVDETISYPNQSGQALNSLTLSIAANLWPNCFSLTGISVDGLQIAEYGLSGHQLDIPLQTPLAPDSVSTIKLRYSLSIPYMDQVNSLRARIFGYSDIQMNLVNWYPFVVPNVDGEWSVREPWSHGEYLVYPLADFEVSLVFANPENAPVVASSGYAEEIGGFTRYTLTEGRSFALSASRDFEVSNMKVGDITVYSYYLPIYRNAGEAAMYSSAQAVQVFSQKFGLYPHKSLSVVLADFKDSMEFSGLYFHSRSFYDLYDGSPANYLSFVAVHETAHQWWFDGVANDQALEPWLDESLATYSESIFYENAYPDLLSYWWSNRIDFFLPEGNIDLPVYNYENDDSYRQAVYFNGASFLQELRERIGDEAFLAFLQDYFTRSRGQVVGSEDFFRILDEHTTVDYSDIVRAYFKNK